LVSNLPTVNNTEAYFLIFSSDREKEEREKNIIILYVFPDRDHNLWYEAPTRCWSHASLSRKHTGHGHPSEARTTRCWTLIFLGRTRSSFWTRGEKGKMGVDLTVALAVAENRVIREGKHNINLIIIILFNQFVI